MLYIISWQAKARNKTVFEQGKAVNSYLKDARTTKSVD